jgi:riboflavin synthase alpha subunit
MFTGLIEAIGAVARVERVPSGLRVRVATRLAPELSPGDSVAVNGVCLTVVERGEDAAGFDIGPETMRVTALAQLREGAAVNLERAMRADTRVGGHFVQGHVDNTTTVLDIRPDAGFTWLWFALAAGHAPYVIPKGAIAIDGISLTIATLEDERFAVQIVPYTWEHTNLPSRRAGDAVNVEFDMLGKYAVRAAQLAADRISLETRP